MDTSSSPTVAVTGAAGYIGSRVVHKLRTQHPDWTIRGLDNYYRSIIREIDGVSIEHVDVRDRERLEATLKGADIVMHLAAISGVEDCATHSELAYEVNVQGTENVAWFCRKHGAGLVFPYSMAVIGDPQEFPITIDHPRDPLNWYGRSKLLGERSVETFAEHAFPAHQYMISNAYGRHVLDEQVVSKGTVINFFVNRALSGEPLTVYEPGTQSRNFLHVKDIARAYVRSAERMTDQLAADETGTWKYELASDEDPSVRTVAEIVRQIAATEGDIDVDVELVENPREDETLVEEFTVDSTRARRDLGWTVENSVEGDVRTLLQERSADSTKER